MRFLYPSMFWALTAFAIPIAIHLFNFRRHKLVYFSNTSLLKTIQQENAKTKKLKYFVTLCLRCLFIAALVLAFAFPYKSEEAIDINTEEGLVGIYLDNSMSMKAQSSKTTLLEDARESARNLVEKLSPSTRYLLMTNSFEVQNEYPMNREEMLDQLDRMNLDGPPVKMNEIIDRFGMLKKRHGFDQATLFVYSDFQRNMFELSEVAADSALRLVVVPMRTEMRANVSIDSVWLDSPVMQVGIANEIHVQVTNHGEKEVKGLPINLTMEGKVAASATADIEGESVSEVGMQFVLQEPGFTRSAVTLMDYPITFDDTYGFVLETRPTMKVIELNDSKEPSDVSLVFDEDPQFDFIQMEPSRINLQELSQAQFVVVDRFSALNETMRLTLNDIAAEGASVVFFHDDGIAVDTNAMAVSDMAIRHDFFNDMILDLPQHADFPKVSRHVRLTPSVNASVLMHLDNGDSFLVMKPMGKGNVFDFATTLDAQWSTLADNSLFVPLMLKMALLGGGNGRIAYTLGVDKTLVFSDLDVEGDGILNVRNEDGSMEMMPAHEVRNNRLCVFFQDALPEAGFYDLMMNDSVVCVMAWNESRLESDMHFVDGEAVEKAFAEADLTTMAVLNADEFANHDLVQAMARKSTLWRWFALLALLALAGEVAVLRFWK